MFRSRALVLLAASFAVFQSSNPVVLAASRTAPAKSAALGTDYASALATADRFLQAWQTGDAENGLGLLTGHAKKNFSREDIEAFFSASAPAAYEITRGKPLRRGRYEFPVRLLGCSSSSSPAKAGHSPRLSTIVVLRTGNNDWAIDRLP